MKKCVILSMDDTKGHEIYDHLLEQPLKEAGWHCDTLSWRATVDWNDYDLVMIRSPWDYQLDSSGFLNALAAIDASSAHLDNPIDIVRWNIDKRYLKELETKGISIVPTVWLESLAKADFADFFERMQVNEIVIKPCIGLGALDTFRLSRENYRDQVEAIRNKFIHRPLMVQPFMQSVVDEGEFSVFYFDGEYSHTILKTPKQDDFRVQEEWGGRLLKVEPDKTLITAAKNVLTTIDQSLLYARLDFIRNGDEFALMEAELIEPSLYFNLDPESPRRYVEAMDRRMRRMGIIS